MASAGDVLHAGNQEDILTIVPDLISATDARNG